jgi:uncharacterized membrane protein
MQFVTAYAAALLAFGIVDLIWLSSMANVLYRPVLGDILLPSLRVPPAVVFYLMFPVGIVTFAVLPGLKADSIATAAFYGLLFGAFAYATYDLTNYATLRNWTLQITLIDIAYGAAASAFAAAIATWAAQKIGG